jgi:hypothetical protein
MLLEPNRAPMSAHVVVLGNEKGGSGKSTTAMHVAIALTLMGQRVATIDLDSRQKSFTRYIDNRRAWARHARLNLKLPVHFCVARGTTLKLDENESIEFAGFAEAVSAVERSHDFVVVDTPGTDSYLTRLAHSMADTLITPEGLAGRVIYRELFPRGLTELDNLDEPTLGTKPGLTHAAARLEVLSLVEALRPASRCARKAARCRALGVVRGTRKAAGNPRCRRLVTAARLIPTPAAPSHCVGPWAWPPLRSQEYRNRLIDVEGSQR